MMVVFEKPKSLTDTPLHYCPGCTHGIIHRLVAQAIDDLGVEGRAIGVAPVGCAVMAYDYFACDMVEAAHGRAPAVATGLKRSLPDNIIFTYQGDGDLASIGMAAGARTTSPAGCWPGVSSRKGMPSRTACRRPAKSSAPWP
ncbi:MAG: hypothetical protein IKH65_04145, partial [Clostridia bacterium]|nr:hypothetical protein [Clostridia bacterium]